MLGSVITGVGETLAKGMTAFSKAQEEDKKKTVLAGISGEYDKINQGLMQGSISPSRAKLLINKTNSQYQAAYPEYVEEFKKVLSFNKEGTSSGDALAEAERNRQIDDEIYKDAAKMGMYVDPNATPEQKERLKTQVLAIRAQERTLELLTKRQSYEIAKNSENRAATDWDTRNKARHAINTIGSLHWDRFHEDVANAFELAKKDPAKAVALMQNLESRYAEISKRITSVGAFDQGFADMWRKNFDELRDFAVKNLDPKKRAENAEVQLKELKDTIQYRVLSGLTPKQQNMWAGTKLFDHPSMQFGMSPDINAITKKLASDEAPNILGTGQEKDVIKQINGMVDYALDKSDNKAEDIKTTATTINNLMKQAQYQAVVNKNMHPKTYEGLATFFSSDKFLRIRDHLDKEALDNVRRTFEYGYNKHVRGNVLQKLDGKVILGEDTTYSVDGVNSSNVTSTGRVTDFVDIKFDGAGVKFMPKALSPDAPYSSQVRMRSLQNDLKGVEGELNKIVKMAAYMEGESDVRKYWEEHKHEILPRYFVKGYEPGKPTPDGKYVYLGGDARNPKNYKKVEAKDGE